MTSFDAAEYGIGALAPLLAPDYQTRQHARSNATE